MSSPTRLVRKGSSRQLHLLTHSRVHTCTAFSPICTIITNLTDIGRNMTAACEPLLHLAVRAALRNAGGSSLHTVLDRRTPSRTQFLWRIIRSLDNSPIQTTDMERSEVIKRSWSVYRYRVLHYNGYPLSIYAPTIQTPVPTRDLTGSTSDQLTVNRRRTTKTHTWSHYDIHPLYIV